MPDAMKCTNTTRAAILIHVFPSYNRKPSLYDYIVLPRAVSVKMGVHKYTSHTSCATTLSDCEINAIGLL
jgi:hypothetical protein